MNFRHIITLQKNTLLKSALTLCAILLLQSGVISDNAQAQRQPNQRDIVLFLGDSIGAGYRIPKESSWVHLADIQLHQKTGWRIQNASVSGETSTGGLRRLPQLLQRYQPKLVVVELGGNDALRGSPPSIIAANLTRIIDTTENTGAQVAIIGITLPPNFGSRAVRNIERMYSSLAQSRNLPFMSLVDTKAGKDSSYLMVDRIHPNKKAQPLLRDALVEFLLPIVQDNQNTRNR